MLTPKITSVKPMAEHTLHVCFENGKCGIFDVKPYIRGSWFSELADENYFRQVYIIDDGCGIEWPNGQDIAPHELYDMAV